MMKLAYRIVKDGFFGRARFNELLTLFDQYPACVDEVSIFEQNALQGYYPLNVLARDCEILSRRIETLRSHGIRSVGVNSLITLGHADDSDFAPQPPFQTMVGHDGRISPNCMCPNSDEFRSYTREKYQMYAKIKPDFIWVDDDIRMDNHGVVNYACFCPICLGIFNQNNQTRFTREELVERLNAPDGSQYRAMWVRQNTWTINRLMALIGQSVHEIDPAIDTGLMTTGGTTYNGQDYPQWFSSLEATKIRPGGGFYEDSRPHAFINKILSLGRQMASAPPKVTDIQYELENYPYQSLQKPAALLILECTASLVYGCNGLAVNALFSDPKTNRKYMAAIEQYHSQWREMDRIAGCFTIRGLYPAFSPLFEARRSVSNGNWFECLGGPDSATAANILNMIGIPLTMRQENACAVILSGNMAEGFTRGELRNMLAGGVLMDVRTLDLLTGMGLGEYCGVKTASSYDFNVYEQYTDDPLNGDHAGLINNTTALLGPGEYSYTLECLDPQVRVLNNLVTVFDQRLGPTMTAYENALGGRVVVNGYMPWKFLYSEDKIEQMRNVCDWISHNRMPVHIRGCVKVIPFIKIDENNQSILLMLTNAFMDETDGFDLEIRVNRLKNIYALNPDGSKKSIDPSKIIQDGRKTVLHIDHIGPWQFMIIIGEGS